MNIDDLVSFNPWWASGKIPDRLLKSRKRRMFDRLLRYLETSQIVSLTGLRRTGKTTLFYQLMDHLLFRGVSGKNIIHFSFDMKTASISEIISLYHEYIRPVDEFENGDTTFLFLDEIQKLDGWENHLKVLYDRNYPLKIFISGSAGTAIHGKSGESLAGRVFTLILPPLTFREYLDFRGIEVPATYAENGSTGTGDHPVDFEYLEAFHRSLVTRKGIYLAELQRFVRRGGFIEGLKMEDELFREYINSAVTDKIVFRDIPDHYNLREPAVLRELLRMIAEWPGQLLKFDSLSSDLGRTRQTISNYIHYLENAFLITLLYNFSGNFITSARKAKKIYMAHPCIAASLSGREVNSALEGMLIENLVVSETKSGFFFRDSSGGEVDLVLRAGKTILPVEVKYQNEVGEKDTRSLVSFMKRRDLSLGIMVTKDKFSVEGNVLFIPAFMFLLLPGNAASLAVMAERPGRFPI